MAEADLVALAVALVVVAARSMLLTFVYHFIFVLCISIMLYPEYHNWLRRYGILLEGGMADWFYSFHTMLAGRI